ncbi:hypothetical protein [Labrys sp. 22185]|uniref:hypothetical protein n=1 Tax=Labrys sp. 22185 TaxID=3453888 RepID=UPI003F867D17
MKTPIKSFVVEVKRSRMSGSAAIRPDAAQPPKVTVAAPVEGASPARQAAEQLFKALLTSPSPDRQDARVLEDVLGTVSKVQDLKEESMSHAVDIVQVNEALADSKRIDAKKAPADSVLGRKRTKVVKVGKSQKAARRPKEAKAIPASAPVNAAERGLALLPHCSEGEGVLTLVAPMGTAWRSKRERDWKPGERWKRRLRVKR